MFFNLFFISFVSTGLCCSAWTFSSCDAWTHGLSAGPVAGAHGFNAQAQWLGLTGSTRKLSSWGSWAQRAGSVVGAHGLITGSTRKLSGWGSRAQRAGSVVGAHGLNVQAQWLGLTGSAQAQWLGLTGSTRRLSSWGSWAQHVLAHELCCSAACGIFLNQGLNSCLLHWRAYSYPLYHHGSPKHF